MDEKPKKPAEVTKTNDLTEKNTEISEIESVLLNLDDSFSKVAAFAEPVKREYEMLKAAKRLDIPVDSYRRMFENYYLDKNAKKDKYPWLKPVRFLDQRLGDFVKWCENISIYSLATVIGQFTLLAAMGSYFMEAPQREQQALDAARQEIRNQKGIEYSQARIDAMQMLSQYCENLLGEQAPKANLEGIKLNNCYHFHLDRDTFAQWPPQFYKYEGLNLSQMNLAGANLRGANLEGANLEGANLEGANLERANLKGANLKLANLKGSILHAANLERANLEEANLDSSRMSRINFRNANLKKASIINSRLVWSDLQGAQLSQADFQYSNLNRSNLQGADLYKANFQGASLRYADLRNGNIMIGANIEGANLKRAKFWSEDQVKRAYNWEKAIKDRDWEAKIANPGIDIYKVGFLIRSQASIYKIYQQGIEKAAEEHKQVEVFPIQIEDSPQAEAQAIKQLLSEDIDAIMLIPQDVEKSIPAILEAYVSGAVVVNIGTYPSKILEKIVFACYGNDYFKMGYDLGKYMATWSKTNLKGQEFNLGLVDGADSNRVYPYFKGLIAGLQDSGVKWNQTASTNARGPEDIDKVKEMLKKHPNINVLWGGTQRTTQIALRVVDELGLKKKVNVFGIVPLTHRLANMLIDPNESLQSIVDESPSFVGYKATQHAIAVIEGKTSKEYEYIVYKHRLFTKADQKAISQIMGETLNDEKNNLIPSLPLKPGVSFIPSQILSSLNSPTASLLPAINDQAAIEKVQQKLQQLLVQNKKTSLYQGGNQTVAKINDNLVYRLLTNKEGEIIFYEPLDQLALNFVQNTPLKKLLSPNNQTNQPLTTTLEPLAEFKVVFTPNGKVEVRWGETFLQDE